MAAIYQWYENGILYTILTTTLYPGELLDGVEFDISLVDGYLLPIALEAVEFGFSFIAGNIETILLSTGPHDEAVEFGFSFIEGNLEEKLVEAVIEDHALDFTIALINGSLVIL